MPRTPALSLLLVALGLTVACGGSDPAATDDAETSAESARGGASGGGDGSMAPDAVATIHLFSLYRLQGLAEGIPCDPASLQPLAAAAENKKRGEAAGEATFLVAVGDTLMPTGVKGINPPRNLSVRTRANVILEAMALAGVDLYVPGQADLAHDPEWLLSRCKELGIPVLMSNIEMEGRNADIEQTVILEDEGFRLACLGITRAHTLREKDRERMTIKKARVTANVVSQRLEEEGEADFVLVFSNVAQSPSLGFTKLPSVHAVLGTLGPNDGTERGAMLRDGAIYMLVAPLGREVGHSTLRVVGGDLADVVNMSPLHELPQKIENHQAELDGYIAQYGTDDLVTLAQLVTPDNPDYFLRKALQINENREYVAELLEHTGSAIDHRMAEITEVPADSVVAAKLATLPERFASAFANVDYGPLRTPEPELEIPHPDNCLDCHQAQYDFWKSTDHAGSYQTLTGRGMQFDALCLGCHTTGFDVKGGYRDPREEAPFGPVSCYDCHGTTFPHFGQPGAVVDTLFTQAESDFMTCDACHTERRSPDFRRAEAMEQIRCPPMSRDEPALVKAWHAALGTVERREGKGELQERDLQRKVRALVGLGRIDEAVAVADSLTKTNRRDSRLAIELASLLDEVGRSAAAIESIRTFVRTNPGDAPSNEEYVRLLVHATDPRARDPEAALRELRFILPPGEAKEDESALAESLRFHVLYVDALMASGQREAGIQKLLELGTRHANDIRVRRRLMQAFGSVPEMLERGGGR